MKDYTRIARRIAIVLLLSQSLSSAGFIAAFAVNALVGVLMISPATGSAGKANPPKPKLAALILARDCRRTSLRSRILSFL